MSVNIFSFLAHLVIQFNSNTDSLVLCNWRSNSFSSTLKIHYSVAMTFNVSPLLSPLVRICRTLTTDRKSYGLLQEAILNLVKRHSALQSKQPIIGLYFQMTKYDWLIVQEQFSATKRRLHRRQRSLHAVATCHVICRLQLLLTKNRESGRPDIKLI